MSHPKTIAIIPARMAAFRFPGKPLAPILGLPMIEHVRRRAELCPAVDEVVVATCDPIIYQTVLDYGGKAVMTAATHTRCTTRVEEAMNHLEAEIVVNVQGDEPLIRPEAIAQVVQPLQQHPEIDCTNLLSKITDLADFTNRNIVKAAVAQNGSILFFSRAAIPYYFRQEADCPIYRQMGIMAFRTPFLSKYTCLPETPFERIESIDMLRLLEHGYKILGVPTAYPTVGVDQPEDILTVESILNHDPAQQAIYAQIMSF